jgi:hypothetical protein
VRATCERPALLSPADLAPLRTVAGDAAIDYALVAGGFHFINRIADLLHVDAEVLPDGLRRVELLRRASVRLMSFMFSRVIDLGNRAIGDSWEDALARIAPRLSALGPPAELLAPLRSCPRAVEVVASALEERDERSSLDRSTIARVHGAVEAALPRSPADVAGFHARPDDPVQAFALVGTRYAQRTTPGMIDALRRAGHDDIGILDLAIAIADANQWARTHRLLGLEPRIFYVDT